MPIKDQCKSCKNCGPNETCSRLHSFGGYNSTSCPEYIKRSIDLTKKPKTDSNLAPTATSAQETASSTVKNHTAPDIKPSNEPISGWLKFFLIITPIGALIYFISSLLQVTDDYGYIDIIIGVGLVLYTAFIDYSFVRRRPGAVFAAKSYLIYCFCLNLFIIILGENSSNEIIKLVRSLISGIAWFLYFIYSEQVNDLCPKGYRKTTSLDRWFIGLLVAIPILCFGHEISKEVKAYNDMNSEITYDMLSDREYTDGRIVFELPAGFTIEQTQDPDSEIIVFSLENDESYIYVCSDYTDDFTRSNFDEYWESWKLEDFSDIRYKIDRDSEIRINGNQTYLKVVRYYTENPIYWYYALIHHEDTGKEAVVSYYKLEESYSSDFVNFLNTIEFYK